MVDLAADMLKHASNNAAASYDSLLADFKAPGKQISQVNTKILDASFEDYISRYPNQSDRDAA